MTVRMVKLPNVSITYGTIFTTLGAAVSLGTYLDPRSADHILDAALECEPVFS
jgi:hypothetical protein